MEGQQIARTIIEQMGGKSKLFAMVKARQILLCDNGVQFSFSGSRKANKCRVTLDPAMDLYIFELLKVDGIRGTCEWVCKLEGVYWDMLIELFEKETGLYLSL